MMKNQNKKINLKCKNYKMKRDRSKYWMKKEKKKIKLKIYNFCQIKIKI